MTYYSANHYAIKAEKSMNRAESAATRAETAAAQSEQATGKIVQLGFDGAIEDGVLVFTHAPSGVEAPYELLDDYEYEVDLSYTGADLSSLTEMYVKNGADTITFVSAEHRPSTELARVADMDAVMRYNSDTGYRWLFKATFKIAPNGAKVFLLYPVVAAKDYSDKTNCITEIPQDIKLELVDGVLTLKAGSVIIVPYGIEDLTAQYPVGATFIHENFKVYDTQFADGKFFVWVKLQNNIAPSTSITGGGTYFQFLLINNGTFGNNSINSTSSGTSEPSSGVFYNTSSNLVYNVASKDIVLSLPFSASIIDEQKYKSVTQVFNGFGYIGSTVWVDKGVKGLIPNGRNADGSLRNVETAIKDLITRTFTGETATLAELLLGTTSIGRLPAGVVVYDKNKNINLNAGSIYSATPFCTCTLTNGAISNFTPKPPFRAVDYSEASGLSAPSEKFINLSIGANKAQYTAPADGYVFFSRMATGSNQSVSLYADGITTYSKIYSSASNQQLVVSARVGKGKKFNIGYSHSSSDTYLKFVYAEGEI